MSNFLDKFNLIDQDCRHLMFWHSEHTRKEAAGPFCRQALSLQSTDCRNTFKSSGVLRERQREFLARRHRPRWCSRLREEWQLVCGGNRRFFCVGTGSRHSHSLFNATQPSQTPKSCHLHLTLVEALRVPARRQSCSAGKSPPLVRTAVRTHAQKRSWPAVSLGQNDPTQTLCVPPPMAAR